MQSIRIFVLLGIMFSVLIAEGQGKRSIYRKVKKANHSFAMYKDSSLLIKSTIYNRLTKDTFSLISNYYFEEKKNYRFYKTNPSRFIYSFSKDTLTINGSIADSVSIEILKPYVYDDYKGQGRLYELSLIPTKLGGDFGVLDYKGLKLHHLAEDSFMITQFSRRWGDVRSIYFTKPEYRIYKIEFQNNDLNRPDAFVQHQLFYFLGNKFDSLNEAYQFGKYSVIKPKKKLSSEAPKTQNIKNVIGDSILLLNDTVLTGIHDKYILFDYWYLGCAPCLKMMPVMEKMKKYIDTSKVIIVGVNPYDDADEILRFFNERDFTSYQMDFKLNTPVYELNSFPQLILVNEKREQVEVLRGFGKSTKLELIYLLKKHGLTKN
jgi:thiol-disulfide isomerase/thioredoxin